MSAGTGASPLVSVIVPAYNAQAFIATAVACACAQSYRNLEVLVVDDGSRDRTAAIVRALIEFDPRVRLLTQRHRGVAAARNRAIAEARGQYIAPLDADDVWFVHKIERQVQALRQAAPGTGLAYGWSVDVDEYGRLTGGYYAHEPPSSIPAALVFRNFIGCSSVPLIARTCLEEVGLYQPRYAAHGAQGCEDLDLYRRLAERYGFVLVREFLVGYRQARGRMSSNSLAMARSFGLALRDSRRRRPDIPRCIFRWSLARQCFVLHYRARSNRQYGAALTLLLASLVCDPRLLLERQLYQALHAAGRRRAAPAITVAPASPAALAALDAERAQRPSVLFDRFERLYRHRLRLAEAWYERDAAAAPVSSADVAQAAQPALEEPRA